MSRDLSLNLSPILALLLIVLTPFGTGEGAHRDQLLDPLFPHVHIGARVQSTAALNVPQRVLQGARPGPAIGAGAGASAGVLSIGLTPPVPSGPALSPGGVYGWEVAPFEAPGWTALADPPPDPPPTAA